MTELLTLLEAIIPSRPIDAAERRRLRNYALLLWLAQTNERLIDESDVFDVAQHPPEELPGSLTKTVDGWLAYVARLFGCLP
jgi:hypothetical protein